MQIILLLGLLTAFSPLSVDMYLPALPAIGAAFSADPGRVQLSLASFFLGLAIGQAFYGPLADRFGRKKPLYAGLLLFILGSAGCALAGSITALIVMRFIQALGVCAGPVIARAVVRDRFAPQESVRVFSALVLVVGVSPILAPILGGQILAWLGWRFTFWVLALFGIGGLCMTLWLLPETHDPKKRRSLALRSVMADYYHILLDRSFIGYALTASFFMAGLFAYIAGSPFVFIDLFGMSPQKFAVFFGANAFGMVLVSRVNVRLSRSFKTDTIIRLFLMIQSIAALLLVAGTKTGILGLYGTAPLIFIYIASLGCLFPNTTAMAMGEQQARAGSASALLGTLQFGLAAVSAGVVSRANSGSAMPVVAVIFVCGISALLLHRSLCYASTQNGSGATR